MWQVLPKQRTASRQRGLGYWVAASLVLNAVWILSIQFDLLIASVPVIIALVAVLTRALFLCVRMKPSGWFESVVVDGTLGLYLGGVCVATAANIAAFLTAAGFDGFGISATVWAVTVVAIAGLVGVLMAIRDRGRIAPTLALGWGWAGWPSVA